MNSFIDIRRLRTALLVALTFAGTFIYQHNFFYRHGGYLFDAGQNAFLFYRAGLVPLWPPCMQLLVREVPGYAYSSFRYHMSPTISLFSLASYLAPVGRLEWFSLILAASYATIMGGMCSGMDWIGGDRKDGAWVVAGGLAGIMFTFSGFIIAMLGYPHLEVLYVAFGLVFLVLLLRGRTAAATGFFVLACGMREDAGFHLTAILCAFWIASYARPHLAVFRRRFLVFMALSFFSSVLLLVIQKFSFPFPPGVPSGLSIAFLGGNGAKTTWHVLAERLGAVTHKGALLVAPVALTCVWAAVRRDWLPVLGWLVYMPWFLLNFLSNDPARQIMILYHGFPFFLTLAWLALITPKLDFSKGKGDGWIALAAVATIPLSSALGFATQYPAAAKEIFKGMVSLRLAKEKPFEDLDCSLLKHREVFGRIAVDQATACMFVAWAGPAELDYGNHHYDTLVFFRNTMFRETMNQLALREKMAHFYKVTDADVIVATRNELPRDFEDKELFQQPDFWLSSTCFFPANAKRMKDGSIVQTNPSGCVIAYGPYATLPPGKYRVTFKLDAAGTSDRKIATTQFHDQPVANVDVFSRTGAVQLGKNEVTGGSLPASVDVDFEVSKEDTLLEFRAASLGRGKIAVKSITLDSPAIPEVNP